MYQLYGSLVAIKTLITGLSWTCHRSYMLLSLTAGTKICLMACCPPDPNSPSVPPHGDEDENMWTPWWTGAREQRIDVTELLIRAHLTMDREASGVMRRDAGRLRESCITAGSPRERRRWGVLTQNPREEDGRRVKGARWVVWWGQGDGHAWNLYLYLEFVTKRSCIWRLQKSLSQLLLLLWKLSRREGSQKTNNSETASIFCRLAAFSRLNRNRSPPLGGKKNPKQHPVLVATEPLILT